MEEWWKQLDNSKMKWLSVIGIGESGLAGLSPIAEAFIDQATVFFGGTRHLSMLPAADGRDRIAWKSPISTSLDEILTYRGQAVCVLASGDPMCYGIGVTLTQRIPVTEMTILPASSTFSLACARLGWSLPDVETLSLCGRPVALLQAVTYPGAKVLVLSEGRHTPAIVADLLTQSGYGQSSITVLEHLGGKRERLISSQANAWNTTELADLNAIALDCIADPGVTPQSRFPGLPDSAYHHDGQITKREVRAVTLSTLAPTPGALLWDVGAGCGRKI
jgi:precorrin-6B C5,15-methyltransferase / cobalt-precorrin-6B C5,C15-methyltransferase